MGGGGSSGGGGGTTQSVSNSYSSLSPWISPYVTSMLGAGQQQVFQTDASGNITGMNPYQAYGSYNPNTGGQYGMNQSDLAAANASVAQFSPLQQQSFQGAGSLQTPGQYGQATGATQYGIANALQMGANATPQDFQNQVGGYMNPYIQNALAPALQLSNQQYGIAGTQLAGQATGQGAFGGSRAALAQGLNAQNANLASNQLIGNAYNNAFNAAQNQYNQSGQFALNANQAAMQNAGQLANIGGQQLGAQQGIINQQNTLGQQGTAQQQAIINQAMQNYQTGQQYPFQQLTNLKSLVSGIPVTDVTQSQQAAAPSTAQLIGSAGLTAAGLMAAANNTPTTNIYTGAPSSVAKSAEGGITSIKRMASGGIGSIYRKALNDPASVPDQSLKDGTIKGLPAQLVQAMKTNEQQQAQMPAQAPTSTVIQDVNGKQQAMAQQEQGMDQQKLLAQLPTIMADLKVARDIAKEKGDKEELKKIDTQIAEVSMLAQRAQEQMQMQPAQGQGPMSAPAPQGIEAAMPQQAQPQAQPQQMAQAPQGIAAFNKGGVARYATEPSVTKDNTPQSGWGSDPNYDPDKQGLPTRFGDIGTYWSKKIAPNLSSLTANMQPATPVAATPTPADNKPAAPDLTVDRSHKFSDQSAAPKASDAAKDLNIPQFDVTKSTNDVTNMISNYSKMLMDQYNRSDTNQLLSRTLLGMGKGMATGVGRQAYANAIQGGATGFEQAQDMSEARKDKLMTQYIAMGMSGMQLQMQAQKLGIDAADLKAKMPMYIADANYKNAMAGYVKSGKGGIGALGNLTGKDAAAMRNEVDSWLQTPSPKTNATLWRQLGQLPNGSALQQKLSASPNSDLYKEGVQELNSGAFRNVLMQNYILEPRMYSSKGTTSSVSSLTGE